MNPPTKEDFMALWRALYGGWRARSGSHAAQTTQCSPMMLDRLIALRNNIPNRGTMTYRGLLRRAVADPCWTADERAFLAAVLAMETL